jgi:hypothetical protein
MKTMSISSNANNAFNREISQALHQVIKVTLEVDNSRFYLGRLIGFQVATQSLCLKNVRDEKNNKIEKIFIRGPAWATFSLEGEPFPMEKLLDRLRKILPGEEIQLSDDNKIRLLGGKLVVTQDGVEGRGPTRERVQRVFDLFLSEVNSK